MTLLIGTDTMNISKMKPEQRIEMKKKQWTVVRVLFFHKNSNSNYLEVNNWNCYPMAMLSFGSIERHTYSTLSGV